MIWINISLGGSLDLMLAMREINKAALNICHVFEFHCVFNTILQYLLPSRACKMCLRNCSDFAIRMRQALHIIKEPKYLLPFRLMNIIVYWVPLYLTTARLDLELPRRALFDHQHRTLSHSITTPTTISAHCS